MKTPPLLHKLMIAAAAEKKANDDMVLQFGLLWTGKKQSFLFTENFKTFIIILCN